MWKWRVRALTGRVHVTRYRMTDIEALQRDPTAERVPGSMLVLEVPETRAEVALQMPGTVMRSGLGPSSPQLLGGTPTGQPHFFHLWLLRIGSSVTKTLAQAQRLSRAMGPAMAARNSVAWDQPGASLGTCRVIPPRRSKAAA